MDNARIHHYKRLQTLLESECIRVMYLPPYLPFFNIIENCFSKWKKHVLRGNANNELELKKLIIGGFSIITEDDCDGYFRNMLRYIERSRNMEIIHN